MVSYGHRSIGVRPLEEADFESLPAAVLAYVASLLTRFPSLYGKLTLEQFDVVLSEGRQRWLKFLSGSEYETEYCIYLSDSSPSGLAVSTVDNGISPPYYDLRITDSPEEKGWGYMCEDLSTEDILSFLEDLYSERIVAFKSLDGKQVVDVGMFRIKAESKAWIPSEFNDSHWAGRQEKVLRHVTKSWNGKYNRELVAPGWFKGFPW